MSNKRLAQDLVKFINTVEDDFKIVIERKGVSVNLMFSKGIKASMVNGKQDTLYEVEPLIEGCLEALHE